MPEKETTVEVRLQARLEDCEDRLESVIAELPQLRSNKKKYEDDISAAMVSYIANAHKLNNYYIKWTGRKKKQNDNDVLFFSCSLQTFCFLLLLLYFLFIKASTVFFFDYFDDKETFIYKEEKRKLDFV